MAACEEHPIDHAMYLTTTYVPHVQSTSTMQVAVHMFMCRKCGANYSTLQEIPRGFLADGTISPDLKAEMEKLRFESEVNKRVTAVIAGKLKTPIAQEIANARDAASHGSHQPGQSAPNPGRVGAIAKPAQEVDAGFGDA